MMNSKPKFSLIEINRLHAAYLETTYEIYYRQETIKLHIGEINFQLERLLHENNATNWVLITAFNPYSQPLTPTENQQRHQQLIQHLESWKLKTFDASGKDEKGIWTPEQSLLILNIKIEQAIAIGKKFEQNAIVYGERNQAPKLEWL